MESPPELTPDTPLPVKYTPTDAAIAELRSKHAALVADPHAARTREGYEAVRVALGEARDMRVKIEKGRKAFKANALEYGRRIDSEANRLTELIETVELPLKAAKKLVDDEAENKRLAAEKAESDRIEAEAKAARDAEEARIKAERDAERERNRMEQERLDKERAEFKAEQDRIRAEQQAAQDKIDAERNRVAEEQSAAQAKIDEANKAIRVEQERIDRVKFEADTKERLATEAEAEVARKAEVARLLEEKNEREEKQRIVDEAAEKKRVEEARPDVEKVRDFGLMIRTLSLPKVTNDDAKLLLAEIRTALVGLGTRCESFNVSTRKTSSRKAVAA